MALTDKLTAIGDAIREQTGSSELMTLDAMPDAIRGISGGSGSGGDIAWPARIELGANGQMSYNTFNWLLPLLPKGTVIDANTYYGTFQECYSLTDFEDIVFIPGTNLNTLFSGCSSMKKLPTINFDGTVDFMSGTFSYCSSLEEMPEDFFYSTDSDGNEYCILDSTGTGIRFGGVWRDCITLRKLPRLPGQITPTLSTSGSNGGYKEMCYNCHSLDEITGLTVNHGTMTSNVFSSSFVNCYRLKNFTFAKQDVANPYTASWSKQEIDLSSYVGYASSESAILSYTNLTTDTQVTDATSYQALKDDPDWWTADIAYSRYNHDSAVRTINSLPDCSAFTMEKGVTNTIKFKGEAGSATDGGAINTLTEAEIAVATAKGWTVQFV